jgi:hypothetical protein
MANNTKSSTNKLTEDELNYYSNHALSWENSNLNQLDYCQQHDIKYKTFVYVRNKILAPSRKSSAPNSDAKFVPVIATKELDDNLGCDAIVNKQNTSEVISIYLVNNIKVEFPASLPADKMSVIFKNLGVAQ